MVGLSLFLTHCLGFEKSWAITPTPQVMLQQAQEAIKVSNVKEAINITQQAAKMAQNQGETRLEGKIRGYL